MKILAQRDRQPELMDQPGLEDDAHRRALDGLRKTNSVSRIAGVIWRGITDANISSDGTRPLRILDIAAGGGDVIIGVAKLAARHGVAVEAHGCDINPTAVEYARHAAIKAGVSGTEFYRLNALVDHLPQDYDVLMCTLFLHHLSDGDAQELLRRMTQSTRRYVLVDDLRRNRLGYIYALVGARLLTRSPIVHTDGPLSVRAAFTIAEVRQLALAAGLRGVQIRRHWPERFLMSWTKA